MAYPVTFEVDYVERGCRVTRIRRSAGVTTPRIRSVCRAILSIPIWILRYVCWIWPHIGALSSTPDQVTRWRNRISPAKNAFRGYAPAGSLWA